MGLKKAFYKLKNNTLLGYYNALGYKLIFPPQGLGDILILLLGLRQYKAQYPTRKVGVIVTKKHFYNLCEIFSKHVDKIIYLPKVNKVPSFVLNIQELIYGENSHFDRFEEAILNTIGVTYSQDLHNVPEIKQSDSVKKMFESKYRKGKTILITPEATTSRKCFSDDFWVNIAGKLVQKNYIPVFNSHKKYGNYDSILLNLEDTVIFANLAGNVLGFRSGLNDVLACFSSAYQVVIYPNNWKRGDMPYLNGFDEDPNGKYMEDGSLSRLFPSKKFTEFIYNDKIDVTEYFGDIK